MVINRAIKTIQEFIKLESAGGIILFFMAIIAVILDNSPLQQYYATLLHVHFSVELGQLSLEKSLLHWVNDGLMAIFFFLVGLEIKREIVEGELNSLSKLALPGFAAIGGMVVPAVIYCYFNFYSSGYLIGWAIPTATDIAFALGLLTLFGKRIPISLKVFLTALAILDDLGAIIIIAIFYTQSLSYLSLALAVICLVLLFLLNITRVTIITPYILVGFVLWVCVLKSGVHATLAGVALAMAIPLRDPRDPSRSPLREIEHSLHPWVAFGVLPIFAFFNAGVSFAGITLKTFTHSVPLGIALGLFLGKQIGVMGSCWIAVRLGIARLPQDADWLWMYGIALLCGIGFTMSLFIGTLAFAGAGGEYAALVRLGVIAGSLLSGLAGYFVLLYTSKKKRVELPETSLQAE